MPPVNLNFEFHFNSHGDAKNQKDSHFFLRTSKYMGEGGEFDDVQRKEHVGSSCVFCQILVYLFYSIQTNLELDVLRKKQKQVLVSGRTVSEKYFLCMQKFSGSTHSLLT